jgi:hypothetical protein
MKAAGFFQLHLTTVIVATLIVGALLYANFAIQHGNFYTHLPDRLDLAHSAFGWPLLINDYLYVGPGWYVRQSNQISAVSVIADISIAVAILASAMIGCEYLLRRRKVRRS